MQFQEFAVESLHTSNGVCKYTDAQELTLQEVTVANSPYWLAAWTALAEVALLSRSFFIFL